MQPHDLFLEPCIGDNPLLRTPSSSGEWQHGQYWIALVSGAQCFGFLLYQTPLMDAVLPELVEALLSEAKAVRVEARRLLRIIAACQKITLTDLLKPYVRLISDWLPPKNRQNRLANLPITSQVAVIVSLFPPPPPCTVFVNFNRCTYLLT
ncbi:unnamed protein product [Dibothriocephalus latus]|uniref:Uncharacterized protein n=1 Tax=Dibothriocephalus latus TaxID=60516 RepID=A0A3P7R9Z7_DIBLA|nr:unnamed protein product [Dibothriocephalus latus]